MEAARGDEIPYGAPPEMFAGSDIRQSVADWLDDHDNEIDAADFFAGLDPEGPFRYCGSFDPWDGIWFFVDNDPHRVAEVIREWIRDRG